MNQWSSIILDTNVFIWLANKNAKYKLEQLSQEHLQKAIKKIVVWRTIWVPAIVPHELKRKDFCDNSSNSDNPVLQNIFEKHPEWVLNINNETFEYIWKINDVLGDHKDKIKYQDKIIIALWIQYFGPVFSVLTADYQDFIQPFLVGGYVEVEKTIWMLTKEEIREQGTKVCDKYKSENMYLINYNFSHGIK